MRKVKDLINLILNLLDGKKTYIGGAIVFFAGGAKALGWIDDETFKWVVAVGQGIMVVGFRHAITKLMKE